MKGLLLTLLAALAIPATVNAGPIPEISDQVVSFEQSQRIKFKCPVKVTYKIEGGRREEVITKLYSTCWADFHKDHINIMDKQIIKKVDVIKAWRSYNYSPICSSSSWQLSYRVHDKIMIFSLNKPFCNSKGSVASDAKNIDQTINSWLSQ